MLIMPSFQKRLIVEQFQGNYLNGLVVLISVPKLTLSVVFLRNA